MFLFSLLAFGCDSGSAEDQMAASVDISNSRPLLARGQARSLTLSVAAVGGGSISDPSAEWSSSDESVLTVDETGRVETLGRGTATVTAVVDDVSDSVNISVVDLEGTWQASVIDPAAPGGVNVLTYELIQSALSVSGTYSNLSGFPPLTSTKSGSASGRLEIVGPTVSIVLTIRISGPPCNIGYEVDMKVTSNFTVLKPESERVGLTSDNCDVATGSLRVGEVTLVQ